MWPFSSSHILAEGGKRTLPTDSEITKLNAAVLQDESGSRITFENVVKTDTASRCVVVFIRHFFCGFCEEYVRALAKDLSKTTLLSMKPATKLVVVGHGDYRLINEYKKRTGCPYEMYTNPSRSAYKALGFSITLKNNGAKPVYSDRSFVSVVYTSFLANVKAGRLALFGGRQDQNGGELIFVDGRLLFINRMLVTVDHLGVDEMKKQLNESEAHVQENSVLDASHGQTTVESI